MHGNDTMRTPSLFEGLVTFIDYSSTAKPSAYDNAGESNTFRLLLFFLYIFLTLYVFLVGVFSFEF